MYNNCHYSYLCFCRRYNLDNSVTLLPCPLWSIKNLIQGFFPPFRGDLFIVLLVGEDLSIVLLVGEDPFIVLLVGEATRTEAGNLLREVGDNLVRTGGLYTILLFISSFTKKKKNFLKFII